MGERMRVEAREPILDRMPLAYNLAWRATAARPPKARPGARMSARGLPIERSRSCRTRAPRHGCQPCLRESRPRAASRRHYPRVRVALVGDTHSSRAVRPTGACRAPATNAACMCAFEATMVEGRQRPNLKSEDSGLRHRFSEAKVSLWMCENGTGHEESRGPTRR